MTGDRSTQRFDDELRHAARQLVSEELPGGILAAAPAAPAGRGDLRIVASAAAAIAVFLVAVAVVRPWPGPSGSGSVATFRPSGAVELELRGSGYACTHDNPPTPRAASPAAPTGSSAGRPAATAQRPPDLVCGAPPTLHPAVGAIVLSVDASGAVHHVHGKAGILGTATATAEAGRDTLLSRLIGIAFSDAADAAAARTFLARNLPLVNGGDASTTIDGVRVTLERDAKGGYQFDLGDPATQSTQSPSAP